MTEKNQAVYLVVSREAPCRRCELFCRALTFLEENREFADEALLADCSE
jgi:hypothetical protein